MEDQQVLVSTSVAERWAQARQLRCAAVWESLQDKLSQLPEEEILHLLSIPVKQWGWGSWGEEGESHCLVGHLYVYRHGPRYRWPTRTRQRDFDLLRAYDSLCVELGVRAIVERIHQFLRTLK